MTGKVNEYLYIQNRHSREGALLSGIFCLTVEEGVAGSGLRGLTSVCQLKNQTRNHVQDNHISRNNEGSAARGIRSVRETEASR